MIRSVRPDGTIETGGVFVPILRRRVVDRIASAALQRVVLIVAPAGYGKSVALRHYLDTVSDPCVRYDVLPDNATLLGFLRGLADAVAVIAPDARVTLAGAHEKNADSANPGADLAMWMHSHIAGFNGTIAIDDLHVAQADREVTRFLAALIERTRGRIQWVIASRSTQGLPIGTWLAYGESDLAIDEHDLKFSVEEAKEAARAFRLGVRDEELYELLNLTDGWATAMSFALRSSTRSVDLRSVTSLTRDMIYRYLAEQVYASLDDAEREFIEAGALLPTIDLDVMVAAGFDRAAGLVNSLRERSAFIQERTPGSYRLHDLFREFVLHQRELRTGNDSRAVAATVGGALERLGRVVPALHLYAEHRDAASVERLLDEHGLDLLTRGFADEIEVALKAGLARSPESEATVVGLRGLLELMRGRYDEGEASIARAFRLPLRADLRRELLLRLAIHRFNVGSDPAEMLENELASSDIEGIARTEIEAFLGVCHARCQRSVEADAISERIGRVLGDIDSRDVRARVLLRLGTLKSFLRDHAEAKPLLSSAAELAAQCALWGVASKAHLNLSVCLLFGDGDATLSLWNAQQAAVAATRAGDFYDLQASLLAVLSLETRRGNAERAVAVEKQLAELSANQASRANFVISSQAHRHAWQGRYLQAHRLFGTVLDRQVHSSERALVHAMHAFCLAMDGETKLCANSVERAASIVDRELILESEQNVLLGRIAVLFAVIAEVVAGRMTSAARILKKQPRSNNPVGSAMYAVVEHIVRLGRSPAYSMDGIEADLEVLRGRGFGGYAEHVKNAVERLMQPPEAETDVSLTPSELRMLRYLAGGLAPKDIAAEMGRSEQTVRTHIKHLIRKLNCHGKDQALAVARQLGLLSDGS